MKLLPLILAIFLIVFQAVPDGLYDEGKKTLAGVLKSIYLAVVTIITFAFITGVYFVPDRHVFLVTLAGYLLMRFSLFYVIYNLTRGLPIFFIGTTKIYDKVLNWFFKKTGFPKDHFLAFVSVLLLIIGVVWLVRGTI